MFGRKKKEPFIDDRPLDGAVRVVVWQERINPIEWQARIDRYVRSFTKEGGFWFPKGFEAVAETKEKACQLCHDEIARLVRKQESQEVC